MMSMPQKSRKKSALWRFFTEINRDFARCNKCRAKLSYRTSTSNLKKHIKTKHPKIFLNIGNMSNEATTIEFVENKQKDSQVSDIEEDQIESKFEVEEVYNPLEEIPEETVEEEEEREYNPPKKPSKPVRKPPVQREEAPVTETFEQKGKWIIERKDECALFCDYLAEKMRKMDRQTRAILQHQINNLMFQAEMEGLKRTD